VTELAVGLGMSRAHLFRIFTQALGVAPSTYLKQNQVQCAQNLLSRTTLSTTTVAYQAGFGTRRAFFRAFRRATGTSPASWRAQA
jgi:transcriptional regulator GlxA family with amidase domain